MELPLRVCLESNTFIAAGRVVRLNATEAELLFALWEKFGEVVTYDDLHRALWGWSSREPKCSMSIIRVTAAALRLKLAPFKIAVTNSKSIGYAAHQADAGLEISGCIRWTPADIERLRADVAANLPWAQIAEHQPGRSIAAVMWKARMLGLRKARNSAWTPERVALLHRLIRTEGLSYSLAGPKLGISREAVAGAVRNHLHNKGKPPCASPGPTDCSDARLTSPTQG